MAKRAKAARVSRRIGFGRREKLVVIGALGLIAIGAIHFVIFNPRIDRLNAKRADFERVRGDYERMQNHVFIEREINEYNSQTRVYREQLVQIVAKENFSIASLLGPEESNRAFRERVRRLTRKWLSHQRSRSADATSLDFIGILRDPSNVARGNILWNIPDGLPEGVTSSMIQDNLLAARGAYRLIQFLSSDPSVHQREFNAHMVELGVPVFYLGADHISYQRPEAQFPDQVYHPYRLVPDGVERDFGGDVLEEQMSFPIPLPEWQSLRLPAPIDTFCACAHIELLLDALYPPPFDAATMARAESNPASLTSEQQTEYQRWQRNRETERVGNDQRRGLEDLLDVNFSTYTVYYNLALDHVERLVDMAIEMGLSRVIMVKIFKYVEIREIPDPWEIPEPEPEPDPSARAPSGPQVYGEEMYERGAMEDPFAAPGATDPFGGGGVYSRQQRQMAPPPPAGPPIVTVAPINIRVTGEYSRVMQYFIELSTGPSFYNVEEISIRTEANGMPLPYLAEGHVEANIWVLAPLYVPGINPDIGNAAQQLAQSAGSGN
ncbi:hypothetical protein JXA47_11915 [Candidatus Sumerlaeota bacterium]|nr:hypothetical protein [Candidatus Sumerlaeota bacterium]